MTSYPYAHICISIRVSLTQPENIAMVTVFCVSIQVHESNTSEHYRTSISVTWKYFSRKDISKHDHSLGIYWLDRCTFIIYRFNLEVKRIRNSWIYWRIVSTDCRQNFFRNWAKEKAISCLVECSTISKWNVDTVV